MPTLRAVRVASFAVCVGLLVFPLMYWRDAYEQTELPRRVASGLLIWGLWAYLAAWGGRNVLGGGGWGRSPKLLLVFTMWSLVSWIVALVPSQGIDPMMRDLETLGWFLLAWELSAHAFFRRGAIVALCAAACVAALVGHGQFLLAHGSLPLAGSGGLGAWLAGWSHQGALGVFPGGLFGGLDQADTPASTFGHPNMGAEFVAMALFPLLASAWGNAVRNEGSRTWNLTRGAVCLLAAGLCAAYIAETGSRAVMISLLGATGLAAIYLVDRSARVRPLFGSKVAHLTFHGLMALALVAGLATAASLTEGSARHGQAPTTVLRRLRSAFDGENTTVTERVVLWKNTLAMMEDRPVAGFGPGGFPVFYPAYAASRATHATGRLKLRRQPAKPHNDMLHLAVERGWIGAALWLLAVGGVLVGGFRGLARAGGPESWLRGSVLLSLLVVLAASMVSFPFLQTGTRIGFWVLAAVVLRAGETARPARPAPWPQRLLPLLAFAALFVVTAAHGRASLRASEDHRRVLQLRGVGSLPSGMAEAQLREELIHAQTAWVRRPDRYHYALLAGDALRRAGRPFEAERAFRSALDLHPNLINAHVVLAELLLNRNDVAGAKREAEAAVALNPRAARAALLMGRVLAREGLLLPAMEWLRRALDLKPDPGDRLDIHVEMARIFNLFDKLRSATEHLQRAASIDPTSTRVLEARAQILERNSPGSPAAFQAWSQLMEADPLSSEARLRVGLGLLDQGDAASALVLIDEAFAIHPLDPTLLLHRARALTSLGRLQDARDSLLECMRQCIWIHKDQVLFERARSLLRDVEKRMGEKATSGDEE
ncbi:MAG TPA: tetratricopeptide repeat protein [Planctomycetes bacterium]|nr:tetratricopeptide repeat protein [Planctomycetota bacterium]